MKRFRAGLVALLLGVSVCGVATGLEARAATPSNVRTVSANTTDPAIGDTTQDHDVIPTSPTGNGKLFVFLPGSGAAPLGYDDVIVAAAAAGYHSVGLAYSNNTTATQKCAGDPTCYGPFHHEVFDGSQVSTKISVTPAAGVEHRLAALLTYLNNTYPTEGWGSYVSGGLPIWSKVVIGGHSQGASEAAYTGELRNVAGVLLFSGVVDGANGDPQATWLTDKHLTPSSEYVALSDTNDPWTAREQVSWTLLGLTGASSPTSIDSPPLVTSSHSFTTGTKSRTVTVTGGHNEPVVDDDTPLCSGSPALAPVWTAMLALAAGSTNVAVNPAC